MKRLGRIAILLALISSFSCMPREVNVDALLTRIRNDFPNERYSVTPSVASIFIDESLPGGAELKTIMNDLTGMEVVVIPVDAQKNKESNRVFREINKRLDRQGLALIGKFRSEKEKVDVWMIQAEVISDLVVVNQTNSYIYVVRFKGDMSKRKIDELIHPENRPILEYLYRLKAH